MTITYANGKTLSGIILSRRFGYIRVAVQGCEDVVEFTAEKRDVVVGRLPAYPA